jgi:integrase
MRRRGRIVKRGDTWSFVVDINPLGAPGRDQLRRGGFETKRDAQNALTLALADLQSGAFIKPQKLTVAAYLDDWLATMSTVGRRATTLHGYRRHLAAHVIPAIGDCQLQSLTALDLDRLYAHLLVNGRRDGTRGLSMRTVRYIHSILRKALSDAERKGIVVRNVAVLASPPSTSSTRAPEMRVWTPAQTREFLDLAFDNTATKPYAVLFRLAATTGMRRGELCGLRWSDTDLDNGRLSIRRQLTTAGERVVAQDVKTNRARRVIDIDDETVSKLRTHRTEQLERRLAVGHAWHHTDLVFCGADGSQLHPNTVSQSFDRLIARSHLPRIRFHDLRHGHASHLLAAGVNAKVVSERLGHASVAFTLDTYAHVMPGQQRDAALAAAALLDGNANRL